MVLVVACYTPLSVTVPDKCDECLARQDWLSCYTGSSCRLFVAVLSVNLDLRFVRRTNDSDWAAARQTSRCKQSSSLSHATAAPGTVRTSA